MTGSPEMTAREAALSLARRHVKEVTPVERRNEVPGHTDAAEAARRLRSARASAGIAQAYFRTVSGQSGTRAIVDGQDCLNFSSYDYLGLNADPRPAKAAVRAIAKYGLSATGSPLVAGQRDLHAGLEAELAAHYGTDDAMLFVSGHATNVATIMALVGPGDGVMHDGAIHNSVAVGARGSGAARLSFPHNDLDALENLLVQHRERLRNILVVVEGVYSMDGDMPALAHLAGLRERYGFWLMVDEAHALGVAGPGGEGSFAGTGIPPGTVDIWMGTLSKALASTGGYIAGSAALVEDLRDRAAGYVFSVALPPVLAAGALEALRILKSDGDRVRRLQRNGRRFLAKAREIGLDCGSAAGLGVLPVIVGHPATAMKASERMLERGINVAPVAFPGVAIDASRLRFFVTSEHSEDDVDRTLDVLREELGRIAAEGFAVPT